MKRKFLNVYDRWPLTVVLSSALMMVMFISLVAYLIYQITGSELVSTVIPMIVAIFAVTIWSDIQLRFDK